MSSGKKPIVIFFALFAAALALLVAFTPIVPLVRFFRTPTRAVMPVAGLRLSTIRSSWGEPRSGHRRHEGADLFAARGTPILSTTDGQVLHVGANPLGGNSVWVLGEGACLFYYAHLDSYASGLSSGQTLRRGDVLGYVGNTGNAIHTPPHLHFGIYPLSNSFSAVDPVPLLSNWDAVTLEAPAEARTAEARKAKAHKD